MLVNCTSLPGSVAVSLCSCCSHCVDNLSANDPETIGFTQGRGTRAQKENKKERKTTRHDDKNRDERQPDNWQATYAKEPQRQIRGHSRRAQRTHRLMLDDSHGNNDRRHDDTNKRLASRRASTYAPWRATLAPGRYVMPGQHQYAAAVCGTHS